MFGEQALSGQQLRALRIVYAHFHEHSAWPEIPALQHSLFLAGDSIPLEDVLNSIPSILSIHWHDGEVSLTARGVFMVAGADAPELRDLVKVVEMAVERYRQDVEATLSREHLLDSGMGVDEAQRVYLLMRNEPLLWRGGSSGDWGWEWKLSRQIWRFASIHTTADYFSRSDEIANGPAVEGSAPEAIPGPLSPVLIQPPLDQPQDNDGSRRRPTIFISYSHRDRKTLTESVLKQLRTLETHGFLDVWLDTGISAGDEWFHAIRNAIERADLAVLLISAEFLASRFITRDEVPMLLQRRLTEGMRIYPILLSPCPWEQINWLSPIQMRPWDAKSVYEHQGPRRDRVVRDMVTEISDLLRATPSPLSQPPGNSKLSATEICSGLWLKIGEHGHAFLNQFHSDGSLTEWPLFDSSSSWKGSWSLRDTDAVTTVITTDTRYELTFRIYESDMISGLETYSGHDGSDHITAFRLVKLSRLHPSPPQH